MKYAQGSQNSCFEMRLLIQQSNYKIKSIVTHIILSRIRENMYFTKKSRCVLRNLKSNLN